MKPIVELYAYMVNVRLEYRNTLPINVPYLAYVNSTAKAIAIAIDNFNRNYLNLYSKKGYEVVEVSIMDGQ